MNIDSKPNLVVIMAGGRGTRLGDLTQDIPKPMLPIGGKPILEILIDSLADSGFRQFVLCVKYKADYIRNYFGHGKAKGIDIQYVEEKGQYLGTAGPLGLLAYTPRAPFLLINGDILTKLDFLDFLRFHQQQRRIATMCVRAHTFRFPYGVVELQGKQVAGVREKPTLTQYINAGIYAFNPEILAHIPLNQYLDITDLFDELSNKSLPGAAYLYEGFWMDIGTRGDYEKACQASFQYVNINGKKSITHRG